MEDDLVATLDNEEDVREEAGSSSELDKLDPQAGIVRLRCGIVVKVLPLRTRQMFKLLRVITHGAGQALQNAGLDFSEDAAVFMQKLISVVLFSIPDAEQEAIDFLQSMVEPEALVDKPPRDLSKADREHNVQLWTDLNTELWNPDPADTLDLVECIVRREAADIQALGKRIRGFLELASKTGQLGEPAAPESQAANSSETSPAPSTSSRTSTAGKTVRSSTSPSDGSGRSSAPSRRGNGKKSAPDAP